MSTPLRDRLRLALRILGVVAIFVFLFRGPQLVFLVLPKRTADVVIVDKTVARADYRGHAALTWLLSAMNVRRSDGHEYDAAHDYVGFDPATLASHDLEPGRLEKADVLFLADTYGVYASDFLAPDNPATIELSKRIYGGLTVAEADGTVGFAKRGGLVIGEFNTFASPTGNEAREKMEALFGARWTRWVGRFWRDLADTSEVPRWLRTEHQRIFGKPLPASGSALVFLRDQDMVVLRGGEEVDDDALRIERVASDDDPERKKLPDAARYRAWFDVVEAGDADVVYEYVIPIKGAGGDLLFHHGLNARFPAVVRRHGVSAWYFAGNFIDGTAERGDPDRAAILWWRKHTMGDVDAAEGAFWGWYAPILQQLIDGRARPLKR